MILMAEPRAVRRMSEFIVGQAYFLVWKPDMSPSFICVPLQTWVPGVYSFLLGSQSSLKDTFIHQRCETLAAMRWYNSIILLIVLSSNHVFLKYCFFFLTGKFPRSCWLNMKNYRFLLFLLSLASKLLKAKLWPSIAEKWFWVESSIFCQCGSGLLRLDCCKHSWSPSLPFSEAHVPLLNW